MNTKPWYQSRTLWLNLLALLLAVGAAVEPVLPALQGLIPQQVYAWIAFALPVGNAVLRFVTSQGLAVGGTTPQE